MADAIDALIESVEAGTASTMGFEDAGFDGWAELAYFGSLDAAKALHEALLHGRDADIEYRLFGGLCDVTIYDVGGGTAQATSISGPARAWLLATLRAWQAVRTDPPVPGVQP